MEKQFIGISTDKNQAEIESLATLLTDQYDFNRKPILLVGAAASKSGVLEALNRLSKETYSIDTLVVYFSGQAHRTTHEGYWIPNAVATSALPTDKFIAHTVIFNSLQEIRAEKTVLIADTYLFPQPTSGSLHPIWFLAPKWETLPVNPISSLSFLNKIGNALKTNEEAAFSIEALVQKMNQYPIGKVTAIGYGCATEQREFQWVQKESKALLWKAIQKAGSSVTIEMYDHFIQFCKRNKIVNDPDLYKALEKKGILEGKARLAGVLDEKDEALRTLYQQLERQNRLTANALNESSLFQQEKMAAESEIVQWKIRTFIAGLFCIIGLGIGGYGFSRKRPTPNSGAPLTFTAASQVEIKELESQLMVKKDSIIVLKTQLSSKNGGAKNEAGSDNRLKTLERELNDARAEQQKKQVEINNLKNQLTTSGRGSDGTRLEMQIKNLEKQLAQKNTEISHVRTVFMVEIASLQNENERLKLMLR